MSDDPERAGRRAFEPPPWETEQFEELARRRAAESQAVMPQEPERPETPPGSEGPKAKDPIAPAPGGVLDEAAADAMLVRLSGEERTSLVPVRKASKAAAWGLGLVGSVVVIFGLVLSWRSWAAGPVGIVGGLTVVVMGAFIAGAGAWLWVRASR